MRYFLDQLYRVVDARRAFVIAWPHYTVRGQDVWRFDWDRREIERQLQPLVWC